MTWPVRDASARENPSVGISEYEPEVIFLVIWFATQLCEKCFLRCLGVEDGHQISTVGENSRTILDRAEEGERDLLYSL
jgi:hypothetical protein